MGNHRSLKTYCREALINISRSLRLRQSIPVVVRSIFLTGISGTNSYAKSLRVISAELDILRDLGGKVYSSPRLLAKRNRLDEQYIRLSNRIDKLLKKSING